MVCLVTYYFLETQHKLLGFPASLQDDTSLLLPAETTAADTLSAWPRRYRQSGCHVHTVAARLLQRAASSTSTVHHGAIAAGHECSSTSRLQPPVTGPRHTGADRAALVADNSSSPVQTVSARALGHPVS